MKEMVEEEKEVEEENSSARFQSVSQSVRISPPSILTSGSLERRSE